MIAMTKRVVTYGAFMLLLLTEFVGAKQPDLWVLTSLEPPFSQRNERGQLEGLSIDVAKGILQQASIEQDILAAPWERVFLEAQSKSNVLVFSVARTEEREDAFFWICPLTANVVGIYSLHEQPVTGLAQLEKTQKYGVLDGDYRIEVLEKAGVAQIVKLTHWAQGITSLLSGEIDNLFFSSMGMQYYCQSQQADCSHIKLIYTHQQVTSYLALSKGTDAELVTVLKNAAIRYKQSAEYEKIVLQWIAQYQKQNGLHMHLENGVVNLWSP
jgi:polar amino acid transport system substrate-binding protein